jgi:hypothetical protein
MPIMKCQKIKMLGYIYLNVSLIILIILSPLNTGLCGEISDMGAMENISIDAVKKAYNWTKNAPLISRLSDKTYFSETSLYRVLFTDVTPPPIFIVAIDKNKKNADVFLPYRDAIQFLRSYEAAGFG